MAKPFKTKKHEMDLQDLARILDAANSKAQSKLYGKAQERILGGAEGPVRPRGRGRVQGQARGDDPRYVGSSVQSGMSDIFGELPMGMAGQELYSGLADAEYERGERQYTSGMADEAADYWAMSDRADIAGRQYTSGRADEVADYWAMSDRADEAADYWAMSGEADRRGAQYDRGVLSGRADEAADYWAMSDEADRRGAQYDRGVLSGRADEVADYWAMSDRADEVAPGFARQRLESEYQQGISADREGHRRQRFAESLGQDEQWASFDDIVPRARLSDEADRRGAQYDRGVLSEKADVAWDRLQSSAISDRADEAADYWAMSDRADKLGKKYDKGKEIQRGRYETAGRIAGARYDKGVKREETTELNYQRKLYDRLGTEIRKESDQFRVASLEQQRTAAVEEGLAIAEKHGIKPLEGVFPWIDTSKVDRDRHIGQIKDASKGRVGEVVAGQLGKGSMFSRGELFRGTSYASTGAINGVMKALAGIFILFVFIGVFYMVFGPIYDSLIFNFTTIVSADGDPTLGGKDIPTLFDNVAKVVLIWVPLLVFAGALYKLTALVFEREVGTRTNEETEWDMLASGEDSMDLDAGSDPSVFEAYGGGY